MQALRGLNNTKEQNGWIKGIILVVAWILIFSLVKDFWKIKKGFLRIDVSLSRLEDETKKNTILKDKLNAVMSEGYKEKIIREQLNMQKVGEVVAVLPKMSYIATESTMREEKTESNLGKWWALIK